MAWDAAEAAGTDKKRLPTASKVPHATLEAARASPQHSDPIVSRPVSPRSVRCTQGGHALLQDLGTDAGAYPNTRAVGTGAEIKKRPLPPHTALGAASVIHFNLKSAAPIKRCQVLPEQPVVPFLALTAPSLMRQMRSPGPFPK